MVVPVALVTVAVSVDPIIPVPVMLTDEMVGIVNTGPKPADTGVLSDADPDTLEAVTLTPMYSPV